MNLGLLQTGEFYSAACALLWAIAVILFRKSGEQVSPVALNLFKDVLGLGLFVVTMLLVGLPFAPEADLKGAPVGAADWAVLLVSGAIGIGVADTLFFVSLNRLGAGRSAIVDCLYSPFVVLCAWVYLGEPVGVALLAAVALMTGAILVGAWVPDKKENGLGPEARRDLHLGVLLGIVSMALMAVGIVMAKPVLDRSETMWATSVRLLGGIALMAVIGLTRAHRADVLRAFRPGRQWMITVPAGVVGAYLAMLLWIMGMKYTYASVASVLNQLSAILVLALATVFLHERLTWRKALAILMGMAGGVIASL
jgi:drug/metabolite transporter (DMT)-like permease